MSNRKLTKKAKRVKVVWTEIKWVERLSSYQCPCCHTIYQNTISPHVTRFICDCGQELIVE